MNSISHLKDVDKDRILSASFYSLHNNTKVALSRINTEGSSDFWRKFFDENSIFWPIHNKSGVTSLRFWHITVTVFRWWHLIMLFEHLVKIYWIVDAYLWCYLNNGLCCSLQQLCRYRHTMIVKERNGGNAHFFLKNRKQMRRRKMGPLCNIFNWYFFAVVVFYIA